MVSSNAIYIAQFISVIMFVMGFAVLVNAPTYKKIVNEFIKSPALMHIGGLMSLIAGFLIIKHHNSFEPQWSLAITIFGCLSFVKGVMLVAFPNVLIKIARLKTISEKFLRIEAVLIIAISLVLGYFGFNI